MKNVISITAKQYNNTIYIAEFVSGDTAKETACEKVERLILNDTKSYQK